MNSLNHIKNNFHKDGFVHIKKLFQKKDIKSIFSQINEIKNKSIQVKNPNMHFTSDKKLNTIHDINTFIKSGPIIKISKDKKLIKIVETILGEKASVRNIEFFLKPKKTGMRSPFHQDNFYWNFSDKEKALNAWIACSNSNYNNGGVCYYKKSHKLGILPHEISYLPGSSQKVKQNYLNKIKLKRIYPNLKVGDCLIHHSEVIHGSNVNKSNYDRVGLVIGYKSTNAVVNKKKIKKYKKNLKKNIKFLKKNKRA